MKIKFFLNDIESDVIEVPDDISEDELNDMACDWVADNVAGFWKRGIRAGMKKEQYEALLDLSVWQRKIGFAQGVLESMDSPAVEKAISELQDVSVSMYSFIRDLIEKGGDIK